MERCLETGLWVTGWTCEPMQHLELISRNRRGEILRPEELRVKELEEEDGPRRTSVKTTLPRGRGPGLGLRDSSAVTRSPSVLSYTP